MTQTCQAPERYQAMLRPEGVGIVAQSGANTTPDANQLPGRIKDSQYLGAYTEYTVDAGGATVRVHSRRDFDLDAPVMLTFAPANCRLIAVD